MDTEKNFTHNEYEKCKKCMTFFGCQAFQGHCSSCYKKLSQANPSSNLTPSSIASIQEPQCSSSSSPYVSQQADRKRCYTCSKKLGQLGTQCKCGFTYCNRHRLPEDHTCSFDFRKHEGLKLQKGLIKIQQGKIEKIQ